MTTSTAMTLLLSLDLLLTGFVTGTTVWFFFIQSPHLFQRMGREKFVPIMMGLTKLSMTTIFVCVVCVSLTAAANYQQSGNSAQLLWALAALVATSINHFFVVRAALQAGAESQAERKGDNSRDVKDFAVQGGSKTQTKTLHQSVVAFVLLMTGASVGHLVSALA